MAPGTEIDERIKEMIANEELDLVDHQSKELLLGQQFSHLSNKYKTGASGADGIMDDGPTNIRIDSPDPTKLDKAQLQIGDKQRSEVEKKVIQYVRKES